MTHSSHPLSYSVSGARVDLDGDLVFTIAVDSSCVARVCFTVYGTWIVLDVDSSTPEHELQTRMQGLCARYIIEHMSGGKTP